MPVRRKRVESEAAELLQQMGITTPPVPVEAIARELGLEVRFEPLDSDLSGFLYRTGQRTLIGVNSHHAAVRQRVTIAHEIGHFRLHDHQSLHVDRTVFARLRGDLAAQGTDPEEIEANLFASALLLPQELVQQDLQHAQEIDILDEGFVAGLARRYEVSAQAMLLRLSKLGYVTE